MKKVLTLIIATLFLGNLPVNAQLEKYHKIFILNFIRYIEWPGLENQLSFKIGILSENHPLTNELKAAAKDYKLAGKPIEVVEFKSTDDLTACHILFVPNSRLSQLRKAAKILAGVSVLIITESNDFTPSDAVINILVQNEKMTYTVNEENAKERQLKISSHLIEKAKK
ncbi:YfiR family protein [Geofilum sp. OHC36d9]|uniref:YfiR family protein n=1 Tax=Geofilum sp. OHC36d9 TaxID=3458413 RepID=UPI004034CD89